MSGFFTFRPGAQWRVFGKLLNEMYFLSRCETCYLIPEASSAEALIVSIIRRLRWLQVVLIVLCLAIALPAIAGLIYVWEDNFDPGISGRLEFAAGIDLGDTVDPFVPGNIVDFEFAAGGGHLGLNELVFPFDLVLVPDALGLCAPNCDTHGGGGTKLPAFKKGNEAILFVPSAKKKAAKKGEVLTSIFLWEYNGVVTPDPVTGKKTAMEFVNIAGGGSWVLSSPVPVPEPSTLLFFLCGVVAVSFVRRRIRAQ